MKKLNLFIFVVLFGCAEGYASPIIYDSTSNVSGCENLVYYPIEYSTEGAYVSERGEVYRVTMHFENVEDVFQLGAYTAKDLGMAANAVFEAWQEQELPNPEAVRDYLSVFHVIVLHTKEMEDLDFARLHDPEKFLETPSTVVEEATHIGAYVYWAGNNCFPDVPDEANFFIVFRHYDLLPQNLKTVVHELLHPACASGLSDPQGDHDDERIWDWLDYEHNVQREAMGIFTLDYLQNLLEN